MSGRSTAEIVADLRCVTDGNGWPAVVYEAADRLTELDAERWSPPTGERIPGVPPWQAGRRLS